MKTPPCAFAQGRNTKVLRETTSIRSVAPLHDTIATYIQRLRHAAERLARDGRLAEAATRYVVARDLSELLLECGGDDAEA
jgi:hypothetical protein